MVVMFKLFRMFYSGANARSSWKNTTEGSCIFPETGHAEGTRWFVLPVRSG